MSRVVTTIGLAELHCADSATLLPYLLGRADILLTDGPYGIDYKVNARARSRAGLKGVDSLTTTARPAVVGDASPFDPVPWLAASRVGFLGANHFAQHLPRNGRWVVWDKREGTKPDAHSDGEMAWLSEPRDRPGALRIHRQLWRGVCRAGEENLSRGGKKLHQNQKPVALMTFLLQQLGASPGMTVVDPFMGSGSTGIAAVRMGCRFVGVEVTPDHYETAVARFQRELDEAAA